MKLTHLVAIFCVWLITIISYPGSGELLAGYWHFFFIGLVGAIVANSTGAGGGIIFVPSFSALGLGQVEVLATSLMIQSFGMTAGAIGWYRSIATGQHFIPRHHQALLRILLYAAPGSVLGVLCAQFIIVPPYAMLDIFRVFSIVFGGALLLITLLKDTHDHSRSSLNTIELYGLTGVSFIGGLITAWISIGIGEIVAIYLIMRHMPVMIAVSSGVILSSITVISAVPYHIWQGHPVWEIVVFAAMAAVIGGTVARFLSFRLGPVRLKIFFATWVLVTGLVM